MCSLNDKHEKQHIGNTYLCNSSDSITVTQCGEQFPERQTGVSGPNVTKIVHSVEKFILPNVLKPELRYCKPFRNESATKKIGPGKRRFFDFN